MLGDGTSGAIQKLVVARPGGYFNLVQFGSIYFNCRVFLRSELWWICFFHSFLSSASFIRTPCGYLSTLADWFNTFLFLCGDDSKNLANLGCSAINKSVCQKELSECTFRMLRFSEI